MGFTKLKNLKRICHKANQKKDATFTGKVAWDPSHWFNLAVMDVKEGKTGTLKDFLSNFIEKTNSFSGILNRGKGYSSFFSNLVKHLNNTTYLNHHVIT